MAANADRSPVTTVGVRTMVHAVPSQCSASSWSLPSEFSAEPTAHASLAETVATAARSLLPGVALGLDTTVHGAPCACAGAAASTSGLNTTTTANDNTRATDNLSLISFLRPVRWCCGTHLPAPPQITATSGHADATPNRQSAMTQRTTT